MVSIPTDLTAFLAEKRDSREYRRALAVKFALLGSVSQFARSSERMSYRLWASLPAQSGYTTDGFASYRVVYYVHDCADETAS
jgi:hypothetical protein